MFTYMRKLYLLLRELDYNQEKTFSGLRHIATDSYLYKLLQLGRNHKLLTKLGNEYYLLKQGKKLQDFYEDYYNMTR